MFRFQRKEIRLILEIYRRQDFLMLMEFPTYWRVISHVAKVRVDKIAASGQTSENTGSVFFDGTGDYLTVANSTDFNYGSDDFSIEAWVYYPSSD